MVLENASSTTQVDSFSDSSPQSDNDPYSSSTLQEGTYNIDRTNLPKPIPILSSFFGYNDQFFTNVVQAKIQRGREVLSRPLTEDETSAMAYWTAKQISILSYGSPVGIAAGWWRCYNTAPTMRFPFWQPNLEKFQSEVFPPKIGALKGVRAVMAWHAVRSFAYGFVGKYIGQILLASYATSVAAVGELSDKRLKAFADLIRTKAQERRGSLPAGPKQPIPAGTMQDQSDFGSGNTQSDDASPAGGIFMEDVPSSSSSRGPVGANRQQVPAWPPARSNPAQMGTEGQKKPQDQPFYGFDDASPTGGQGVSEDTTPRGSAWERLRKGQKPAARTVSASITQNQSSQNPWSSQQIETQREQKQGSTMGDRFAFSKSEEERAYAKDEAQKQFDAQVERERRGGDFSSENGDQKRW